DCWANADCRTPFAMGADIVPWVGSHSLRALVLDIIKFLLKFGSFQRMKEKLLAYTRPLKNAAINPGVRGPGLIGFFVLSKRGVSADLQILVRRRLRFPTGLVLKDNGNFLSVHHARNLQVSAARKDSFTVRVVEPHAFFPADCDGTRAENLANDLAFQELEVVVQLFEIRVASELMEREWITLETGVIKCPRFLFRRFEKTLN